MQIKNVDFLLTFKCPAKCQHCSYNAGPTRTGLIKPEDLSHYLKELMKLHPLQSVWVHGGEPFLYFDYLEHVIKETTKMDIPNTGIITNSFWAKNMKIAYKKLKRLKRAGLTAITFSFDCFHQEFIPIEYVKNALNSAVNIGFEPIYVDSYFVEDIDSDNHFNQLTKINLEKLGNLKGVEFRHLIMSVEGRATELKQYIKLKGSIPYKKCPVPFWIEGNLQNPKTIEIDPEGNITLCPGICIGNTKIQSLTEIIQNYDYEKHPILSIISNKGPIGLLELAKFKGFEETQNFVNECHLCYELRRYLQPYFPRFLAPKEIYYG
ncbi:MAG: radical SAM/SPASM domain-containing protein [Candidatus Odinarchaeota archaeon]